MGDEPEADLEEGSGDRTWVEWTTTGHVDREANGPVRVGLRWFGPLPGMLGDPNRPRCGFLDLKFLESRPLKLAFLRQWPEDRAEEGDWLKVEQNIIQL